MRVLENDFFFFIHFFVVVEKYKLNIAEIKSFMVKAITSKERVELLTHSSNVVINQFKKMYI